jgi:Lon protease-like protein
LAEPDDRDVPIFPLNAVLFPGGLLALRVFEQRYMDMTKECLKDNEPFGVCLIRSGSEVGAPALPEDVGCLARVVHWDMQQLGVLQVRVRGEQRFRILERKVLESGLTRARVSLLPADEDHAVPERFAACARLLQLVMKEHGEHLIEAPHRFESSSWVSARLTEILPVPLIAKQRLMELDDSLQRLEILHKFLVQHGLVTQG